MQDQQICGGNFAHLFLSYAIHSPSEDHKKLGKETESIGIHSKTTMIKGHRRFSSWGSSLEDFELECDLFLQTNQKLPQARASRVSKALKKVAQDVSISDSSSDELESRNARFASYLRSALLDRQDAEHTVMTSDITTSSTGQETHPGKEELEVLREQLKRQKEEMSFLRSAVKVLVHSETEETREASYYTSGMRDDNLMIPRKDETFLAESRTDIQYVPQTIEFPRLAVEVDGLSDGEDYLSDVTPSAGGIDVGPFTNMQQVCVVPVISRHEHTKARHFGFDIHPSQMLVHMNDANGLRLASGEMRQAPPDKARDKPLHQSFPDMAKGEIQDKRARGMRCTIYFQSSGFSLQGSYIGMLKFGQPDGSGVLRFDNMDCYVGEFRDGTLNGEGTFFTRRYGRLLKFRGRFEHNEFVGWEWTNIAMESSLNANTARELSTRR